MHTHPPPHTHTPHTHIHNLFCEQFSQLMIVVKQIRSALYRESNTVCSKKVFQDHSLAMLHPMIVPTRYLFVHIHIYHNVMHMQSLVLIGCSRFRHSTVLTILLIWLKYGHSNMNIVKRWEIFTLPPLYVTFSPYHPPLGPIHDDMSRGAATINTGFPLGLLFTVVVCCYIE